MPQVLADTLDLIISSIASTNEEVKRISNNRTRRFHNLKATVPPTATDDASLGYSIGSIWVDNSVPNIYMCQDNTTAAAYWFLLNQANYLFAYDTTDQQILVANTLQDLTFDTNSFLNGWTHTPGSADFICPKTDIYKVDYKIFFLRDFGLGGALDFEGIAFFDGVAIPESRSGKTNPGIDDTSEISSHFLLNGVATKTLKIQIAASSIAGTTTSPPSPSGILNVPSAKIRITRMP